MCSFTRDGIPNWSKAAVGEPQLGRPKRVNLGDGLCVNVTEVHENNNNLPHLPLLS